MPVFADASSIRNVDANAVKSSNKKRNGRSIAQGRSSFRSYFYFGTTMAILAYKLFIAVFLVTAAVAFLVTAAVTRNVAAVFVRV